MIFSRAVGILAVAAVSQAQDYFRISGVQVSNGSAIPLRKDINDLQRTGGPTWDLLVQAMNQMASTDYRDTLSLFQICGIHGMPYVEWNHTGGPQYDGWAGYCPHGEDIFLEWHRPYVLLFEQVLVTIAQQIAARYPPPWRAQYQQAANELRAPQWDWSKDPTVPPCTVPPTMTITVPNGNTLTQQVVANPFYSYTFPNDFTSCNGPRTVRCPAPESYPETANQNMAANSYKDWTYQIFVESNDFESFASTGHDGISLESIHNAIHWDAACGQQFLAPDCAAFDPLFFLHHAHVDFLYLMWQVLHPNLGTFKGSYRGQSRWATRSGTRITTDSPLLPFHDGEGKVYTSNSVAASMSPTFGLKYTYESMESGQTPEQMRKSVATFINKNYGPQDDSPNKRSEQAFSTKYTVQVTAEVQDFAKLPCKIEVCIRGEKAGNAIIMGLPKSGKVHNGFGIAKTVKILQAKDQDAADDFPKYFKKYVEVKIKTTDGDYIDPETVPSLQIHLQTVNMTNPQTMDELPKVMSKIEHDIISMVKSIKDEFESLDDYAG